MGIFFVATIVALILSAFIINVRRPRTRRRWIQR